MTDEREYPTALGVSSVETISLFGEDLSADLIGKVSFGHLAYRLITLQEPTAQQARVFEALVPTGRVLPWEPASFQLSALRSHYLPTLPAPALDPRDDAALRAI